jgi:hypothetical protein
MELKENHRVLILRRFVVINTLSTDQADQGSTISTHSPDQANQDVLALLAEPSPSQY